MSNPGNPAYKSVFNPKFEPLFQVKLTVIPSFGIRNAAALREINPHKTSVCRAVVPPFPPWLIASPTVLFDLHAMQSKENTSPDVHKAQFAEVLDKFHVHLAIFTDGSKIGESVACAAVCSTMTVARRLLDGASSFHCRACGYLPGAGYCERKPSTVFFGMFRLAVISASCSQSQAGTSVGGGHFQQAEKLNNKHKEVLFCWVPSHVGIAGNERVDKAAS
jgi:hypothetical protein